MENHPVLSSYSRTNLFFCWHVIRSRLSTQDRMLNWCYTGNLKCVLCRKSLECRAHFECFFTRGIGKELMKLCLIISLFFLWVRKKISGRENLYGLSTCNVYIGLGAAVYHIWHQRNTNISEEGIMHYEVCKERG